MMGIISSGMDLALGTLLVEDVLFGISIEPSAVGAEIPEGTEVELETQSMFALSEEGISFRVNFQVQAGDLFRVFSIDVASNYTIEPEYAFTKSAFMDFSNTVVAPHLRAYAQMILNGVLSEMKLPPRILPPIGGGDELFQATKLPDILSYHVMEDLRKNPELSVE